MRGMESGQSPTVSFSELALMVVGNAGGVTVRTPAKDIAPIGPHTQVRVVKVTKEQGEILEPFKPTAAIPAGEV